jgi:hypothetical protein
VAYDRQTHNSGAKREEVSSDSFLTSALDGGEWSASFAPAGFYHRGKDPDTH